MSVQQVKAGLMDPAYFLGRREILQWLNSEINTNFQKVEATASGAAACQLLDKMFPGKVPMRRVNWAAKAEYEYVKNYKIIQNLFNKLKVEKHVDVGKLVRGKYQDNLEWMQWMKAFFEANYPDVENYDAVARRSKGKGARSVASFTGKPIARAQRKKAPTPAPGAAARAAKRASPAKTGAASRSSPAKENQKSNSTRSARSTAAATTRSNRPPPSSGAAATASKALAAEVEKSKKLGQENAELKLMVDGLEKERDFYFSKLREVEVMLQAKVEGSPDENIEPLADDSCEKVLADKVLAILYAAEDGEEEGGEVAASAAAAEEDLILEADAETDEVELLVGEE